MDETRWAKRLECRDCLFELQTFIKSLCVHCPLDGFLHVYRDVPSETWRVPSRGLYKFPQEVLRGNLEFHATISNDKKKRKQNKKVYIRQINDRKQGINKDTARGL